MFDWLELEQSSINIEAITNPKFPWLEDMTWLISWAKQKKKTWQKSKWVINM